MVTIDLVKGRNPEFELRTFNVINDAGTVVRTQLGLAGMQVGEKFINTEDGSMWKALTEPVSDYRGVLGLQAEKFEVDPLFATQESWHKAKNHR